MNKYKAQALLVVMLVSAVCLVIVGSLALRTANRIKSARRVKESQVAYGNALSGLEAAFEALKAGDELVDCTYDDPCEVSSEGEYQVLVYEGQGDGGSGVSVLKDRSVDIWIPVGGANTIDVSCDRLPSNTESRGITVTLIYTPQAAGDYLVEKLSLSCKDGSAWGFQSCPIGGDCEITNQDIEEAGYDLSLVRIKAFSAVEEDSISVSASIYSDGVLVATALGYRIDSTGFGYDNTSTSLSVVMSPSSLPYPFDFALFSGVEAP